MSGEPSRALLGLAVGGSILAISTAAVLIVDTDAPPIAIAFHRLLYATLMLLPFALWRARDELRALSMRDWLGLGAVGVVLAIHFAAWITSLGLTSVASSVFLVTLHPVLVALASQRVYGEGVTPRAFAGVALALLGGAAIVWGDGLGGGASPLVGDALALLGALAAATYFLAGRGYRRRLSLLAYVVPVYAASALTLGVLLVLVPAPYGGPLTGYALHEHLRFLALAAVPMVLGHTVLNWALKYVTAPVIATTILGEPVGASILGYFFLGQVPGWLTLAGGALVLIGIGTVALSPTPPRPAPPAAG